MIDSFSHLLMTNVYYYNIKCIHVSTPLSISFKRNRLRKEETQVPKIAYSVYTKHYQEPSSKEGFQLIKI